MGILDEAIREHLELKRQHGADDSELQQLEDSAFGPPQRPGADGGDPAEGTAGSPPEGIADPTAEAPTEFMAQPDLGDESKPPEAAGPAELADAPPSRREMPDIQEGPPAAEEEPAAEEDEPAPVAEDDGDSPVAEEEPSAAEHEAVPAPPPAEPEISAGSHTTEERHAIADQPTEMFDVEEEFAASKPAPADDELLAEEIEEPRLGAAERVPSAEDERDEELEDEDDFFSEQRLSDELDQALEAPSRDPEPETSTPDPDSFKPEPISEEHTQVREPIAEDEPESLEAELPAKDEDVLDDTPEFLEDSPEDEQLWFEQKPPKDFDFDD